jgi:hypothetical protein
MRATLAGLAAHERAEALVLLAAGRTALEVRPKAGQRTVGIRACEL